MQTLQRLATTTVFLPHMRRPQMSTNFVASRLLGFNRCMMSSGQEEEKT